MPTVTVKTRFDIAKYIDDFMNDETKRRIGQFIVDEAKESISRGISPVRGQYRFQGYSDSYQDAIMGRVMFRTVGGKVIPFRRMKDPALKSKTVRPVNLYVTGEMLSCYVWRSVDDYIEVGYISAPEYAEYHENGTEKMPMRSAVPKEGEEFQVDIMLGLKELYTERLTDIIESSNSK